MQPAIKDYAIIGDCRSAALISTSGSIDWLCVPRFDSPAVFGCLLDVNRGGRFLVAPVGPARSERRYIPDTNVLETTFTTPSGVVRVTDLMTVESEKAKAGELWPEHEILRKVECLQGVVDLRIVFDPRFDYGQITPRFERRDGVMYCEHGARLLALSADVRLNAAGDCPGASAVERLDAGNCRYLSMTYAHGMPAVLPPLGTEAERRIERSVAWWREWAAACRYDGRYRASVLRSALVLKLLSYAPSGAIVAAPTTSLPERIGGIRNWDYRYCWLRDASLTLRALCDLGFVVEGEAFLSWLLHATHMTWPEVQMVYGVYGQPGLPEHVLSHLAGYRDSQPVRIGNLAARQFQLDTYGELVEAAFLWMSRGGELDRASRSNLIEIGNAVCARWREPDDGIWERRGGRRQHTHSKVMCWVALDRLVRLRDAGRLRLPHRRFDTEREALRHEIETRGYSPSLHSYVSALDGDDVDASLLVLALHNYADANSPRMRSTSDRIRERLGAGSLLYRYREDDGLPPGEGAFGICGFWEVECLALRGDQESAVRQFESLLTCANDVGLFGEEIDPATHDALGNFPQGLTHIGLVNAALEIEGIGRR